MMAAQPPAMSVGPMPNGTTRTPVPERDQPSPEMLPRPTAIVSTERHRPAASPLSAIRATNHGSLRRVSTSQGTLHPDPSPASGLIRGREMGHSADRHLLRQT